MSCPNLIEWINWVILICKAGKRPYVPALPELREYCKSENYNTCPHYLSFGRAGNEFVNVQEETNAINN